MQIVLITFTILAVLLFFPYYGNHLFGEGEQEATAQEGKVTEWIIEGMTCTGCAIGLQGGMAAVEGITDCTVDYASKTMVCTVDEQKVKVADVPGLVEKMGYHARLKVNPDVSKDETSPEHE